MILLINCIWVIILLLVASCWVFFQKKITLEMWILVLVLFTLSHVMSLRVDMEDALEKLEDPNTFIVNVQK